MSRDAQPALAARRGPTGTCGPNVMEHDLAAIAEFRVAWHLAPAWRAAVGVDPDGFSAWLAQGPSTVVKHARHRTVWRVDKPEQSLFVKRYRAGRFIGRIRSVLQATAAQREFRRALELVRRKVPAVVPIAFGCSRESETAGDHFLVTAAIEGSTTLDAYVAQELAQRDEPARSTMRRKLIAAFANLTASAHAAGAAHNDPHAGNVLVAPHGTAGAPGLFWVDLPDVRISGPLGWRASRINLVMLDWDWRIRASRRERLRFLREYLRLRPELRQRLQTAASTIATHTRRYGQRLMGGRDKRSLADNRDFYRLQVATTRLHLVRNVSPQDAALIENELCIGRRVETITVDDRAVPVDESTFPTDAAALRVWRHGHALLGRGIRVAQPLAVVLPHGNRRSPCLISRLGEPATDVDPGTAAALLGRLLGQLHWWQIDIPPAAGVRFTRAAGGVEAEVVDPSAVRFCRKLSERRKLASLVRMAELAIRHGSPKAPEVAVRTMLRAYAEVWDAEVPDVARVEAKLRAAIPGGSTSNAC
ncbi:MAG TPA: lipopolysaccharide kinase InaA family protein [Pirellulales bacterium]|nr:lipopolysaccharide kinase InaA family protein [Pirellulales bacterium]